MFFGKVLDGVDACCLAWTGASAGWEGILYVSPIFLVKCQLWWLIGVYKEPRVTIFAAWLGPETVLGRNRLYWTSLEEKLIFLIFLDSLYHQYFQFDASYDDWECERNQGGRVDYWRLVVQWGTTMWMLWIFHETASTDFQCVFPFFVWLSPWDVASATGEKEIPLAVEQTLHHHSLTVKNIITITITIITITVTAWQGRTWQPSKEKYFSEKTRVYLVMDEVAKGGGAF